MLIIFKHVSLCETAWLDNSYFAQLLSSLWCPSGVMRAPLRWVLWDVKDTLLKVHSSVGEQYCKEAERMGLSLSPVEVDAAFRQVYRQYSSRYPNYGISQGLNGQSWWRGVVRDTLSQCGVQEPDLLNTVANNLYHNFCSADNWEVNDHWHVHTPKTPCLKILNSSSNNAFLNFMQQYINKGYRMCIFF